MRTPEDETPPYSLLEESLGVHVDAAILERALTHRSFGYENGDLPTNERLELLGDSVLGLVVTDALYHDYPELRGGQLAKLRAAVVNMGALADVGRGLQLGRFLRLGRGEEGTGGRDKASILADAVEALVGAVYFDSGLDAAAALVHRLFDSLIERSAQLGASLDWKASLQARTSRPVAAAGWTQLREPPIETMGMRLRAYAENAAHAWGLSSHLDIDDQPSRLTRRCEEGMLRLGCQAITHACKHAGAHNLWVDVRVTGPAVIRVEDDGTGPVTKRRNSYRWRTLTDIATRHDAYLAIEPRTTGGTIIEITAA